MRDDYEDIVICTYDELDGRVREEQNITIYSSFQEESYSFEYYVFCNMLPTQSVEINYTTYNYKFNT